MPKTSLPILHRESLDNSIIGTHGRCPRKAYYNYFLNRGHSGVSYPLKFGEAFHKYREIMISSYIESGYKWGLSHAMAGYQAAFDIYPEDPPIGHKRDWQTLGRLKTTMEVATAHFMNEMQMGSRKVLYTEQPFTLSLPSGRLFGGRMDEILEWNGKLWVRDYKTTARMGPTYGNKFDPDNQMTGYTWAARQLSGRPVAGVIIQSIYNTKTKGPEIHEFLTTRSEGIIDQWIESIEAEYDEIETHIEKDVWPMRTAACDDFGGCMFREACQFDHWKDIENWLLSNTTESVWDYTNPTEEKGNVD